MAGGRIRAELAADPNLGAGNVLTTLIERGVDPTGPGLTFDSPVDGHEAFAPLRLGELDEAVRRRAAWLHERGIGPRDPVAVYAAGAADQVLTFLALMRLGAIPAPVNGHLAPETVAEYIRRLRPVGFLADGP